MKTRVQKLIGLLGVLGLIVVLFPLELIFRLPFGWIKYLGNVLPSVEWNYEAIISGVVFLILALVGIHMLGVWILRQREMRWRWPWSICVMTMLVAVLVVSLAFGGIAHQVGWLAKTRWWVDENTGGWREITKGRQLLTGLRLYASDHSGSFPRHLDDLVVEKILEFDMLERYLKVEDSSGEVAGTWIYVTDLADSSPGDIPILIGPLMRKGEVRLVGMVDSSVSFVKEKEFRVMLREVVKKNFSGPRDKIPPEYKPFLEGA